MNTTNLKNDTYEIRKEKTFSGFCWSVYKNNAYYRSFYFYNESENEQTKEKAMQFVDFLKLEASGVNVIEVIKL